MHKYIYVKSEVSNKSFIINARHIVWVDINTKQIALSDGTILYVDNETMNNIIDLISNDITA